MSLISLVAVKLYQVEACWLLHFKLLCYIVALIVKSPILIKNECLVALFCIRNTHILPFIAMNLSYRLLIIKDLLLYHCSCNIATLHVSVFRYWSIWTGSWAQKSDLVLSVIMMLCNVFCRLISLKTVKSQTIWKEENLYDWEGLENLQPLSRAHYCTSGKSLRSCSIYYSLKEESYWMMSF